MKKQNRIGLYGRCLAAALLFSLAPALQAQTAGGVKPPNAATRTAADKPAAEKAPKDAAAAPDSATVSINSASAAQLAAALNGVGLKKAQAIVDYREQYGAFTQVEQLQEVKGIGPSILEKNRDRLKL